MSFESDPLALRALAHPLRLRIRELLNRDGALTSTELGGELGVSQALASHHVRQLAKYGYVRPAPGADQRERRWELVHASISAETTEPGAELDAIEQAYAQRALARLREWQELRRGPDSGFDSSWLEHAGLSDNLLYLTSEEVAALRSALGQAVAGYRGRADKPASRPQGARPVALFALITPLSPTERGN